MLRPSSSRALVGPRCGRTLLALLSVLAVLLVPVVVGPPAAAADGDPVTVVSETGIVAMTFPAVIYTNVTFSAQVVVPEDWTVSDAGAYTGGVRDSFELVGVADGRRTYAYTARLDGSSPSRLGAQASGPGGAVDAVYTDVTATPRPTTVTFDAPLTANVWDSVPVTLSVTSPFGVPSGQGRVAYPTTSQTSSSSTVFFYNGPTARPVSLSLPKGTQVIVGSYVADVQRLYGASEITRTVEVAPSVPTMRFSFAPADPAPGDTVTVTATVVSMDAVPHGFIKYPSGDVTLTLPGGEATSLPLARTGVPGQPLARTGTASTTFVALSGTQAVTGSYPGDSWFASSSAEAQLDLEKAATSLSVVALPVGHAFDPQLVVLSATSAEAGVVPTGQVLLSAQGVDLGTVDLVDGTARWTGRLPGGTYDLVATYDGDDRSAATTATDDVTVAAAPTETTLSVPSLEFGQDAVATVDVTVPGSPDVVVPGEVELSARGAVIGTATLVDGRATVTIPGTLGGGPVTLAARYVASADAETSSDAVGTVVARAVPEVTDEAPTVLTLGQPWTVDIDVRGPAGTVPADGSVAPLAATAGTGQVQVLLDGVLLRSVMLVDGRASVTVDSNGWFLTPGTHTLSVAYEGDANFSPRSVDAVIEVEAAPLVPPVVDPPVVVPPVEGPGEPVAPGNPAPLPGAAQPVPAPGTVNPVPGTVLVTPGTAIPSSGAATAATPQQLADTGASSRLLLLLGPLLLAGGVLVLARRSTRDHIA